MPQKLIDLTGIRFGFLVADRYMGVESRHAVWRCLCDCGKVALVSGGNLRSGNTRSCGCKAKELKQSTQKLRLAKKHPKVSPPNWTPKKPKPKQKSKAQIKREQKAIREANEARKRR